MKQMKNIAIGLAALVLAGCVNTIEYDFGKHGAQLMVSGLLYQDEPVHTVYVSLSQSGTVRAVENAKLVCYVNGTKAAEASADRSDLPAPEDYNGFFSKVDKTLRYRQLPVSFAAPFAPGDEVRLEIEADGGRYKAASARLMVPEPVAVEGLDTVRVTVRHSDWSEEYLQARLTLRDRAGGADWFCLFGRDLGRGFYDFKDGRPAAACDAAVAMYFYDMDDPVLLDGNMRNSDDLDFLDLTGDGSFAVFSDRMFRDRTAVVKVNLRPDQIWKLSWELQDVLLRDCGEDCLEALSTSRIEHRGELVLGHCNEETYHYLRALRTISSSDYVPQIVEPVRIPANVEGGIGFVDIVAVSRSTIRFPDIESVHDGILYTE